MKVMHVIPGEPKVSEMIFARRESLELRRAGVEPEWFYLRSRVSPFALREDARQFRQRIQEVNPDLVHAQFGTMTAFFAVRLSPVPVVVTYRGTDLNRDLSQTRLRSFLGRTLSRLAAARAAGIVCVTSELRNRLWWGRGRAVILPGSVDLDRFQPRPRAEARAALGWNDEERVVLFNLGRFPKIKRPDLAKESVRIASEKIGPIRLHILDGSTEPEDVPILMNASDCLVITSMCEGSPTILREAMACNLPVVTVAVGDVRERLEGVSESRIANRDVKDIARGIVELLDPPRRSNGREAAQELSVDRFNQQLLAIYRGALESRGRRIQGAAVQLSKES